MIIIRNATPRDVPAILPMVRQICDLHAQADPERFKVRPDVLDRYASWLPERAVDPRSVLLVAEAHEGPPPGSDSEVEDTAGRGGTRFREMGPPDAPHHASTLVGFTVGTVEPEVPIFWVPEAGWIHDLWVEPHARGRGVAAALIEAALSRFRTIGVEQVRLHTGQFNDAARTIFTKHGFRACVVEMLRPLERDAGGVPTRPQ